MPSYKFNPETFLGVKILTPMEQERVRGGTMLTVQQQQQQQQQSIDQRQSIDN